TRLILRRGNGATAPGANPVASRTRSGPATFARRHPAARATLRGSARGRPGTLRAPPPLRTRLLACVGPTVARNQHEERPAFAFEYQGLDDLAQLGAHGCRRVFCGRGSRIELLDPRLHAAVTEKGGHALDRLRPVALHDESVTTSDERTATVAGVLGEPLEQVPLFLACLRDPEDGQHRR